MISYYLKIALRHLLKRKVFTAINIFGLATSVAVCLLIGKYIIFETSFDKFHTNSKKTYRVVSSFYTEDVKDEYDGYDLGPALATSFPEIKDFCRVHGNGSLISLEVGDKEFRHRERKMLYVDSSFLKMFSFKILKANGTTVWRNTNSVILTETIAKKYFGQQNPIGKVIQLHDGWTPGLYEISAIIQDVPGNSHFDFGILLPMQALLQTEFYRNDHQRWDNFHTYLLLMEGAEIESLNKKISHFIRSYGVNDKKIGANASLEFQNLRSIHYSPDLNNPGSHLVTIYLFASIAVFVLLIAWINYVNLSTARAVERAKEVGVKKAIGVSTKQLITQFFLESGLINLLSVLLAAGIAFELLPVLNSITARSFELNFSDPDWLFVLSGLFLVGTCVSGAYPAFVLSSFKPTEVIKGKVRSASSSWTLRNGLVGFQFACSLLLLVATVLIFRQVNFMQDHDKEFNTKQTIVVKGPELGEATDATERISSFRNELLQYPFVTKVATSFSVPGEDPSVSTGIRKLGQPVNENRIGNVYWIDPYFIDLYGIQVLSGKTWDPEMKTDLESVVVNEEAVKIFKLGDNMSALGEAMILPFDTVRIIGVVKNHHWNSMKKPYTPMIFKAEKISGASVSIQLNGNVRKSLETIEKKYKSAFPDNEFSYYFLDDFYKTLYHEEEVFRKLFTAFAILAVMIGCLGLWGLATFSTMHRQKEISIRKILGASAYSIAMLLVRQFLHPLFISGVFVLPLSWIAGQKWLEKFPYRIPFSVDLLLLPFSILLLVALVTVSYQTLKAARSNHVASLKGE
jgi:putative ABC transport system permease protein